MEILHNGPKIAASASNQVRFLEVHISATRRPIEMRPSLSDSPVHDAPSNMDFDPTLRDFLERVTRGKREVFNDSCGGQTRNGWPVCAKIWYMVQQRVV